ncbi:uncharacterized protein LOC134722415 [Mytilus trossulus]|uniref:uncharacterized protein LOC134722415 n=1 Tax=Mytilus trossulus TaxID=6551 RepID=UPI003004DC58
MVDKRSSQVQSKDPMHQNTFRHENGKHENSSHSTKSSQSVNVSIVNDKEGKSEEDTKVLHTSHKTHSIVLLKTAVAPVWSDSTGIDANIFFDEGAQRSFLTKALALKLKLEIYRTETIQLACFGDTGNSIRHLGKCTLLVETQTRQKIPIEVLVVPKIAVPLQNHVRKLDLKNNYIYLQGLNLAHPITDESMFEITVLIGADYYWQFIEDKIIRGDGPTAVKSKLGYLLSGPLKESATHSLSVLNMLISHKTEEFDIASFWNLESMGINSKELDQENEDYLKTYQNTCIEFQGGQYIAKLPWKREHDQLPTNFSIAKRRTESVIRRLDREPGMLKTYDDIIKNQELKGFIEKIEDEECDDKTVHYIPHHPVRKDSLTTPIRIVYDCSCRQSDQYPSLNDCLMNTPPVLNDLTKLLLRFRLNAIAISTDIEKAFLHVGLHEHDRDATRFLWMSDAENINSKLVTYRFKSVLFGATCSPFILSATRLKHVQTQEKNSDTAKMIEQDIYVDNIISSVSNENKAVQYYKEARELMTKWILSPIVDIKQSAFTDNSMR